MLSISSFVAARASHSHDADHDNGHAVAGHQHIVMITCVTSSSSGSNRTGICSNADGGDTSAVMRKVVPMMGRW